MSLLNDESLEFNFRFSSFTNAINLNAESIHFSEAPSWNTLRKIDSQFNDGIPLQSNKNTQVPNLQLNSPPSIPEEPIIETTSAPITSPVVTDIKTPKKRVVRKVSQRVPQRKKQKPNKTIIDTLTKSLPIMYRSSPHFEFIEKVFTFLHSSKEALSKSDIATGTELTEHFVHKYVNILVQTKNVLKSSDKSEVMFTVNRSKFTSQ
ncbi:hypothetical protein DSO57_1032653 [Entomophthora muscae]|uniref:Uncharacterized protein n=1 Tax=Entomophthora muscae TaxID=34485 RepID=A0ACC2ULP4_9FUNG|nr:hypothetical protein DSO57_1032653 [Entomophthora muscae]